MQGKNIPLRARRDTKILCSTSGKIACLMVQKLWHFLCKLCLVLWAAVSRHVLLLASCNVRVVITQSPHGIQVPRAHEPFRQTTSRSTHFHAAMTVRWFTFNRCCQHLGRVMTTDRTLIASLLYQWPHPQQSRMAMCKLRQP